MTLLLVQIQSMTRILLLILPAIGLASSPLAASPDLGSRGVDWKMVKAKVAQRQWARDALAEMEKELADWRRHFPVPPPGRTGWYHDYFCPDDAARLTFSPAEPKKHVCPRCETVYTGLPYDECWRDYAHRTMEINLRRAAMLYRVTGKQEHLDYVRSVLTWYADELGEFEVHGEHAGKGRIMSQSLGEARLMADLAVAFWDARPGLTEEDRQHMIEDLFLPQASFIHAQTRTIHNIHSWHNAAVGLIGWVSGDMDWVRKAVDGPHGMKQQIRKGAKEDGFWFEGSRSFIKPTTLPC